MSDVLINKFKGRVGNGKLFLEKTKAYEYLINSLEGKTIELTIKKFRKKRTNQQNRYYWVCINFIASEIGEDPEELHQTFKAMFLVDKSGKIPIVKSTSRLTTVEFTEYIEKIAKRVALIGIILPNPEEYYY